MLLRPKRFWTPRYIFNRLMLAYNQKQAPDAPWWPKSAITQMENLLRPSDTCLEYGSGGSTVWLSARTARVHSVEHDRVWFERVQTMLAERGADPDAVQLLDANSGQEPEVTPYVRAADRFADGELDVCIVDGPPPQRLECALAAIPKLAAGGLLLVDDIHWFLDHPTFAPHSRRGKGPISEGWRQFEALVADWRCVWTTDGVTDTAIWIKPCGVNAAR